MQAGFAMLCAGSIRAKNVKNIMLKNILDACGGAVGFWTIGYAFAYGNADSSKITFIGNIDFVLENIHDGASLIGVTALFAAKILGPRVGRFYDEKGNELPEPHNFPPHSVALQVLGTFILWVGWYGFNPGSTLGISASGYADVSALCAVTTTLAAAAGSVSAMFTDMIMTRKHTGETTYDITMCMNGALSGLVGITAGCSVCEPWAALVIGIVAGWVYIFWSSLLVQLKIDDAVDAIPVHFGNGMWGCIATGLFASPGLVANAYGTENYGWFYNWGMGNGTGKLLAVEMIGVLFIIGWVGLIMIPYFMLLSKLGIFRVDPIEELVGLDHAHHGGGAYVLPINPPIPKPSESESDGEEESSKDKEKAEGKGKGVFISDINYNGSVKSTESDEYVEITNNSKSTIDISEYAVVDINHHGTLKETVGTTFVFPTPTELTPGQTVKVYTNEIHPESGGYSFHSRKAIWNNKGGKGVLMDRDDNEISQFVYISQKQLLTDIPNTKTQLDKARDERQVKNREWRRLRKLNARPMTMTTREEKIERREIRANLKIAAKEFTLASKVVTDLKKALKALEGQLEQMKKLGSSCSKVDIHLSDFSDDDSDIESQRCAGEDINVSDISDSESES
eukprot:scaffold39149_cov93-Skeletonema_marinoi.AAC.10